MTNTNLEAAAGGIGILEVSVRVGRRLIVAENVVVVLGDLGTRTHRTGQIGAEGVVQTAEEVVRGVVALDSLACSGEQRLIVVHNAVLIAQHTHGERSDLISEVERGEMLNAVQRRLVGNIVVVVVTIVVANNRAPERGNLVGEAGLRLIVQVVALGAEHETGEQLLGLTGHREGVAGAQRKTLVEGVL